MLPNFVHAEHAVMFATQQHFANVLRLCRGSGNVYEMQQSMADYQAAVQRYIEEVGYYPPNRLISAAAIDWDRDDLERNEANDARSTMYRGALQVVASELLGQSLPLARGESQFNSGFNDLADIRDQKRRERAMADSAHSYRTVAPLGRIPIAPAPQPEDILYFISDGKAIKIGVSNAPLKRLRSLQTAHHSPLSIIATTGGGYELERELHDRFAAHRLAGEWFSDTPEIRSYIAGLTAANDNQPDEYADEMPDVQNM